MTKHKGVKMAEHPEGTTHKNPWLNRYGATCFDWFKIDHTTGEVFQWYTPYMEHQPRWAPPLSQMVSQETWHKTLIPIDQECKLESKPWHKASYLTGGVSKAYDRPENPYYPSSKGYQGD